MKTVSIAQSSAVAALQDRQDFKIYFQSPDGIENGIIFKIVGRNFKLGHPVFDAQTVNSFEFFGIVGHQGHIP